MREANKTRNILLKKRQFQWLSCKRKVSYPTKGKAIAQAMRCNQNYYLCEFCFTYHLTRRKE